MPPCETVFRSCQDGGCAPCALCCNTLLAAHKTYNRQLTSWCSIAGGCGWLEGGRCSELGEHHKNTFTTRSALLRHPAHEPANWMMQVIGYIVSKVQAQALLWDRTGPTPTVTKCHGSHQG